MFYAKYIIKDRVLKVKTIKATLKPTAKDISSEKRKLYGYSYDIQLALSECLHAFNNKQIYNIMLRQVKDNHNKISSIETAEDLIQLVNDTIELFDFFDYQSEENYNYYYCDLEYFTDINTSAATPLLKTVESTNRNVNLFEPNCSDGSFLSLFNENTFCYGTETTSLAKDAKKYAEKIVKGRFLDTKISNDAFDIVIAKCSILFSLEENTTLRGGVQKKERTFLTNITKYIRTGGAILIAIPAFRMYKDMCDYISKNYENVSIFKSSGSLWDNKNIVYIYGQKSSNKEKDDEIYKKLRKCFNPDLIPSMNPESLDFKFKLPHEIKPINLFRGNSIDLDELYDIVEKSNCEDLFFEEQKVKKIEDEVIEPLLPFNIGQIGLVLTSGCLDGVVSEGDGHYHLVKGRVSRKSDKSESKEENKKIKSEIISNRVEINIMLPNGEFKKLT